MGVAQVINAIAIVLDPLQDALDRSERLEWLFTCAAGQLEVVELLRQHQVVEFLVTFDASKRPQEQEQEGEDEEDNEDGLQQDENSLAVSVWKALGQSLGMQLVDGSDRPMMQRIWSKMLRERFASREILLEMAQFLIRWLSFQPKQPQSIDLLTFRVEDAGICELFRHFYVTLSDSEQSSQLVEAFGRIIASKAHAKVVLREGVLRTVLQVAIQHKFDVDSVRQAVGLVRCVCRSVCINGDQGIPSMVPSVNASSSHREMNEDRDQQDKEASQLAKTLCSLIVRLLLSLVTGARQEALRLIQMLLEVDAQSSTHSFTDWFTEIPDLHGALEVAQGVLRGSSVAVESYETQLCKQQLTLFVPRIREYEMQHGSLLGFDLVNDEEIIAQGPECALESCKDWKAKGNQLFRNGNFFAARLCYRRGFSLLQQAQFHEETRLNRQSRQEKLAGCQTGASVQVWCPFPCNKWENAMVIDVEESGSEIQVEVTFDGGEGDPHHSHDDAAVGLEQLRLRLNTSVLVEFDKLRIDCTMNMGKALCQLCQQEEAVSCFSSVLEIQKDHIGALYQRGITHMALNNLASSKQDLWLANQSCLRHKDRKMKALVSAAWKRLGLVMSRKKKLDRKLVKQLLGYLSTIPGLDQDQATEQRP